MPGYPTKKLPFGGPDTRTNAVIFLGAYGRSGAPTAPWATQGGELKSVLRYYLGDIGDQAMTVELIECA